MAPVTQPVRRRLGTGDCEQLRDGWVAQPIKTATSAAYVAAGAAVAARARGSQGRSGSGAAFGVILALVGAGSIAYHGPQPRGAELLHDAPIAALGGLILMTVGLRLPRGGTALPGWSPSRGLAGAGLAAASGAAYAAGRTGVPTCHAESRWQWHGAWHVLSAAALAVVGDVLHIPVEGGI